MPKFSIHQNNAAEALDLTIEEPFFQIEAKSVVGSIFLGGRSRSDYYSRYALAHAIIERLADRWPAKPVEECVHCPRCGYEGVGSIHEPSA